MSRPQKKLSNAEKIIAGFSLETRKYLADCALENMYPSEETLADMELLDSGKMSPKEFEEYIVSKYQQFPKT